MCPKGKNQCLFTLFLDPSQFLLDFSICQIPNFGDGLGNSTFIFLPYTGDSSDTELLLDWEESMRCYLARLKWILFSWFSLSLRTSYFIVPSSRSILLWFEYVEVPWEGGWSKVPRVKLQCVKSVRGKFVYFSLHGTQHCEIQSSTEGPAILLKVFCFLL